MRIAGIDPGLKGAIAIMTEKKKIIKLIDMPITLGKQKELNGREIADFLYDNKVDVVVLEKVHSIAGGGDRASFTFGAGYGRLLGICDALEIPVVSPAPKVWQKHYGFGKVKGKNPRDKKKKIKETSRAEAMKLFGISLPLVKDHDKADALLMARWAIENGRV